MKKAVLLIISVLLLVGVVSAWWQGNQPVGYWKLDETDTGDVALDSSSNNLSLFDFGSVGRASGKLNNAAVFDSGSDYLGLPGSINLIDRYTIAVWVKAGNYNPSEPQVIVSNTAGWVTGWLLEKTATTQTVYFGCNIGGSYFNLPTSFVLNDNNWHRIIVTRDISLTTNNLKIYIDNVLENQITTASSQNCVINDGRFKIGTTALSGGGTIIGMIDDVQIYNVGWSEDDVAFDWNNGSGRGAGFFCDSDLGCDDRNAYTTGTCISPGTKESYCEFSFADADNDGVYDGIDNCPNTPAGSYVDNHGCPGEAGAGCEIFAESCQAVCEHYSFTWTANGGTLNCCGNDPNEDAPFELVETSCNDGRDNDCNGLIDSADSNCVVCVDNDGDGYGTGCALGNDCNDNDNSVHSDISCVYDGNSCGSYQLCSSSCPNAPVEVCNDSIDNDCDNSVDCNDNDCSTDSNCIQEGLVAYYKFEGNANDETGNNNGINNGATFVSGKVGQAASFDGINDYIKIGGDNAFKSLTQGTVEGWFKMSDLTKSDYLFTVGPKTTSTQGLIFWLSISTDGSISIRQRNANTNNNNIMASLPASTIAANSWYHVAWVVGSSENSLYINGEKKALTYSSGSAATNFFFDDIATTQNYWIGGGKYSSASVNRFGYGLIDEVKIWNRALTASEVLEEYNQV